MRRRLDQYRLTEWAETVGGPTEAAFLVMKSLGCSFSKAEKLAYGRYPYGLTDSEQKELAKLTKVPIDALFQAPIRQGRSKAS